MNEKEIRAKCENQMEFDRLMSLMNTEQTHLNHPYLDRDREIAQQRENIRIQMQALKTQDAALKIERMDLEQKRKDINRIFHDLKHELIMLNPREKFQKMEPILAKSDGTYQTVDPG